MAFPAHWSFLISPTNKNADGSNSGRPLLTLIVSHVINILLRPEPAAGSFKTKKESATMQLECSYGRHLFQPWLKIDVSTCQSLLIWVTVMCEALYQHPDILLKVESNKRHSLPVVL